MNCSNEMSRMEAAVFLRTLCESEKDNFDAETKATILKIATHVECSTFNNVY